jgi:Lsr2
MSESSTDPMIAALLRERAGYETRGLPERVEQVNVALAERGYQPDVPQGRSTPPKHTAADPKAVREWAAEQGLECPARGRIPEALVELYVEAQQG